MHWQCRLHVQSFEESDGVVLLAPKSSKILSASRPNAKLRAVSLGGRAMFITFLTAALAAAALMATSTNAPHRIDRAARGESLFSSHAVAIVFNTISRLHTRCACRPVSLPAC